MRAIHQFLPTLYPGDAVGNHTLEAQRILRGLGLESEVYAQTVHHSMDGRAQLFQKYTGGPDTAVIYQLAVGSVLADLLLSRPEPLVVDYHNITPGRFFDEWDPPIAHAVEWGRSQMLALARRSRLGLGDSDFNRAELEANGYRPTAVAPILLDLESFDAGNDEPTAARLARVKEKGGADWLFVGRITPNKCQHDVVKAFAAYRRHYDPEARLHIVGGIASDPYAAALRGFVRRLGLNSCVDLTGPVSDAALASHYRAADVYVCLSEHEGFCVPLLESMHHRVPIVALGVAAVPETLGDAGLCLPDKSAALVAQAVDRVLTDDTLRARSCSTRARGGSSCSRWSRRVPGSWRPCRRSSTGRREVRVRHAEVWRGSDRRRRIRRPSARGATRDARRVDGRCAHDVRPGRVDLGERLRPRWHRRAGRDCPPLPDERPARCGVSSPHADPSRGARGCEPRRGSRVDRAAGPCRARTDRRDPPQRSRPDRLHAVPVSPDGCRSSAGARPGDLASGRARRARHPRPAVRRRVRGRSRLGLLHGGGRARLQRSGSPRSSPSRNSSSGSASTRPP